MKNALISKKSSFFPQDIQIFELRSSPLFNQEIMKNDFFL